MFEIVKKRVKMHLELFNIRTEKKNFHKQWKSALIKLFLYNYLEITNNVSNNVKYIQNLQQVSYVTYNTNLLKKNFRKLWK